MSKQNGIKKVIPNLRPELENKINDDGKEIMVEKGQTIVVEGQYIRSIPIVMQGLLKVITSSAEKDLLVYYIKPGESCIMSFSAALNNEKSRIIATAEKDTIILLLPSQKVIKWVKEYSEFNDLFYKQYHQRYLDLLETIDQLVNENLDGRIHSYLKNKVLLTGKNPIKISHRTIASEVGTSREVVTRIIKKLENNDRVIQLEYSIEVL
ncbi:MAG: Crp/Fnr family transcriptional regulator [Saprospiraceae bacterium]|nr:Crp/Fnr family transcriptional regulator [Saprospiraceae bacterium]